MLSFLPAVVFGIAWVHNFPRWSYPYTALMVLYGLSLADLNSWGYLHWGWRAWLPALVMTCLGLTATRSFRPLLRMAAAIRADWTLATWSLFTLFASFILIGLDDPTTGTDQWQAPLMTYLAVTVALMGMSWFYLRAHYLRQRAAVLVVGTVVTVALAVTVPVMLLGQLSFFPGALLMLPLVFVLLFSPALIELRRRPV